MKLNNISYTAVIILALAGCASEPVQVVNKVVYEECKTPIIEKPKTPLKDAQKSESPISKVKKALAENEYRKAYEKKLEAANKACQ